MTALAEIFGKEALDAPKTFRLHLSQTLAAFVEP
jgi:hypothetical protein